MDLDSKNLPDDGDFDEVSLPGVGDNEQPTILEVLNRGIVNTEDGTVTGTGTEPPNKERNSGDILNTIKVTSTLEEEFKATPKNDKDSDILVSSSSSSSTQAEWNHPQRSQLIGDDEHFLDIESHLIETLKNYSVSEDSEAWGVDIKELPPGEEELLNRSSKIETDPSIGTVFEVEPATPKVLRPVEVSVSEPQCVTAQKAQINKVPLGSKQPETESVTDSASDLSPKTDKAEEPLVRKGSKIRRSKKLKNKSEYNTGSLKPSEQAPKQKNQQDSDIEDHLTADVNIVESIKVNSDLAKGESPVDSKAEDKTEQLSADPIQIQLPKDNDHVEFIEKIEADSLTAHPISPRADADLRQDKSSVDSKVKDEHSSPEKSLDPENLTELQLKQSRVHEELTDVQLTPKSADCEEPKDALLTQRPYSEELTEVQFTQSTDHLEPVEKVKVEDFIAQPNAQEINLEDSKTTKRSEKDNKPIQTIELQDQLEQKPKLEKASDNSTKVEELQSKPDSSVNKEEVHEYSPKVEELQSELVLKINSEAIEVPKISQTPETLSTEGTTPLDDVTEKTIEENAQSIKLAKIELQPTALDPSTNIAQSSGKISTGDLNENLNKETKTDSISTEPEQTTVVSGDSALLTQEIDQKLSELKTHLTSNSKVDLNGNIPKNEEKDLNLKSEEDKLDINGLPLPTTAFEEEQRQQFLDSLPQISPETDSNKVAALAKREYYQSLRQYLITHSDKPPVPPETYRWEDLKRAKQRGGYPWTHLYKRPLGPDEEPEIVLLLRKSQELRFASESPKSNKKVRIDDQVSIKETERYIQELSDTEDNPTTEDEKEDEESEEQEDTRSECISYVSDSVLTVEKRASKLGKIRGILKKRSPKKELDARSLPDTSTVPSSSFKSHLNHKSEEDIRGRPLRPIRQAHNNVKCFPIMKKLRSMADRQKKNFQNIKKISLKKDEKIALEEEQKIIRLKTSPKAERSEIPHFIEKQDSDDVLEIVELDESPSRKRKDQLELQEQAAAAESSVLVPDEIIEIPKVVEDNTSERAQTPEPTVSEILEEELKSSPVFAGPPPKKTARLRREHVYEDIEPDIADTAVSEEINNILELASVEALKQSLSKQDSSALQDVVEEKIAIPFERMGSSEEEVERSHLAPLSSIDSASSEEEKKPHLSPVAEEVDAASNDGAISDKEVEKLKPVLEVVKENSKHVPWGDIELKPALKKEASPSPSEKKVTFSHVEDEAEPHREDIELPEGLNGKAPNRWSNLSDHEYEPIGEPESKTQSQPNVEINVSDVKKEPSPAPQEVPKFEISQPSSEIITTEEVLSPSQPDELKEAEELQKDIEDRYFSSAATTPRTESRTDYEIHTSQVDSSALEELPLKPENRKKTFMASAQDRTRKMQAGLKNQAGKIKTKFRTTKKPPSGSPKSKERKRFKAPEFSKIKMPEIKRPDLSGFKRPEFKRPEFTKFSKPDMSKFKLPDKFSSLKLTRSKSFKESTDVEDTTVSGTTPESVPVNTATPAKKQRFDFSFGTYPRAFRKKSKPQEVERTTDEPSVIPSTETQPSAESSSTPQGDRGPGPVRSRWADKFSDVSYNDSEGSRYRRYGSEQESSVDRESSMERRMKEVLEENAKEEAELAMFGVVEQKQFADYDEENRVIHEISKTREGEFKRRPMVHQDSDLISEEGRDIGWTEREAEKNRLLRKSELEAEAHLKFLSDQLAHSDTQSMASSKKFVLEEIGSDELLLRKKGISRELGFSGQRFVDPQLDAAFNDAPNALSYLGSHSSFHGSDRLDYGYDVPPPKPRRLSHQPRQRHYDSENASQVEEFADDISLSQAGSDYYRQAQAPPTRPLRKGRFKNSQDMSIGGTSSLQLDEADYRLSKDQRRILHEEDDEEKENIMHDHYNDSPMPPPQAPRRRRKQQRESLEKDSYANGFGGRSVSNSYLKEDNKPEEVIVYRTEHEYKIPLASPETYTDNSASTRKSRSLSRLEMDEDDRTSCQINSLALNDKLDLDDEELQDKYIIEMTESDGYAVVRKDNIPKPTPPARRKKFSRSPGERFATMPHLRKGSPPPAGQNSSSRDYSSIGRPTPPRRKSAQSLEVDSQKDFGSGDFDDYEIPDLDDRTESPRNLQSGDIINKMKYRPLPPPPRPPREKRHTNRDKHGDDDEEFDSRDDQDDQDDRDDHDGGGEKIIVSDFHEQSSDDYNLQGNVEVEVSTQTDPLPDDFVCEEFEITEDMKIIEPTRSKTLDDILREEEEAELERTRQIDEEILLRGIQRFREANQRSVSEKSRASSQAKSLSRPQTPSAILIEKRVPTPVPNSNGQTVLEASLTVRPVDDLDLEEELLRREGLYDGSHSKSDGDSRYQDEEEAAHASEEENARIGEEEERSYTRSTDAESHLQDEEEERRLLEERLEAQRIKEEEEEQNILEKARKLLEEVEKKQKLLEEEEEERRILEEQLLREELEKEQLLSQGSRSEELDSYDDERIERLKAEESYELKSEVSEEKEVSRPSSPPQFEPIQETISVVKETKSLSEAPASKTEKQRSPSPSPTPTAPPRKRSFAATAIENQPESLSLAEQQTTAAPIPPTTVMPSHLTLADLEVERLRVHALQAGQVMVSHLHGTHIQADELECRSGNLVVGNIEFPPGFIENIVERVRSSEREHAQAATQTITEVKTQTEEDSIPSPPIPTRQPDIPPVRPPPPQRESMYPTEYIPPHQSSAFLQLHDADESQIHQRSVLPTDYMQSVPPGFYSHRSPEDDGEPTPPVYRRRRHHRRRDSSSEEEQPRRRSRSSRPEPPTVAQAGKQFASACSLPLVNVISQLTNAVRRNNENKQDEVQPRNISAVVLLFIVMTLGFLIFLLTGRNIHHHHWDYFNPPGNNGRLS